jgi:hypothetical protein
MGGAPRLDDATFWDGFVTDHWERRPLATARVDRAPIPTDPGQLFAAMLALLARCPPDRKQRFVHVYVEGQRVPAHAIDALLPRQDDGSLDGYDARVCDQLGGREYLVRMEKLHAFHPPYWDGATRQVRALARRIGLPPGADTAVFLGRYRRTPTGVHHDNLSSFNFPVVGEKTMRVWSSDYVAHHPELVNAVAYDEHVPASTALSAAAGGMIYWPSSAWHIGEGTGAFGATLGIGIWIDKRPLGMILELLANLVQSTAPEVCGPVRAFACDVDDAAAAATLPSSLAALLAAVTAAVEGGGLGDAVLRAWLESVSDLNLKRLVPPPIAVNLGDDAWVAVDPEHALLHAPLADGSRAGASRGRPFPMPAAPGFARVVAELNLGAPVRVGDLADRHPEVPAAELRAFVEELARLELVRILPDHQ